MGCGPQEEFRACADVAITELDGTADSRPSQDGDISNELWPPATEEPSRGEDWNQSNTTTTDSNPARIVVIIFAAIITTGLLFLGLFLYGEGRLTRVQRFASAVVVAISGDAAVVGAQQPSHLGPAEPIKSS